MSTRRSAQRGVALLAFTLVLAIVTLTVVFGYSVSATKKQSLALVSNQKSYLNDVRDKLALAYALNADRIDSEWKSTLTTGPALLALAGVSPRWDIEAIISKPIVVQDGDVTNPASVTYRVMAAWLPMDGSPTRAPILDDTGTFVPCPDNSAECKSNLMYVVVNDGLSIQRANVKKANAQLAQIAANAQSFFNTKQQLDPERNVSINHFRASEGIGCNSLVPEQMPCLSVPEVIFGLSPRIVLRNFAGQNVVDLLGLPSAPLLNPWGLPILTCNTKECDVPGADSLVRSSATDGPPYSMLFRTPTPWGRDLSIYAVQRL